MGKGIGKTFVKALVKNLVKHRKVSKYYETNCRLPTVLKHYSDIVNKNVNSPHFSTNSVTYQNCPKNVISFRLFNLLYDFLWMHIHFYESTSP